jgi:hypothetical protein
MSDKSNPFDAEVDNMVAAMEDLYTEFDIAFEGVGPSNSVKLSPEEEQLIYENPSLAFPKEQLSNAEAYQRLLTNKGAEWYVSWVTKMDKKGQSGKTG